MNKTTLFYSALTVLASILVVSMFFVWPQYRVWQKGLAGQAQLKQAEWNRQIRVKEAEAAQEAATSLAGAEIERAKGVAEANKIIGDSLKDNDAYLRYLWITGLQEGATPQVIYVPTEAGLPILEAGRR